mmetsp:Transcript_28964/g.84890  ORF Transcript_28964/g.84890 Transcript_28964/m.84890 type:complete len:216 (+) Transcript_28964:638-1285(+)
MVSALVANHDPLAVMGAESRVIHEDCEDEHLSTPVRVGQRNLQIFCEVFAAAEGLAVLSALLGVERVAQDAVDVALVRTVENEFDGLVRAFLVSSVEALVQRAPWLGMGIVKDLRHTKEGRLLSHEGVDAVPVSEEKIEVRVVCARRQVDAVERLLKLLRQHSVVAGGKVHHLSATIRWPRLGRGVRGQVYKEAIQLLVKAQVNHRNGWSRCRAR